MRLNSLKRLGMIPGSNKLFFIYLALTAIAAWFSIGFYQVDEHFQILEPGAWKAGWTSAQDLPWEFDKEMRSSVEPFIVFLLIKGLSIINIQNPFAVALVMRGITAGLCITCFTLWRRQIKNQPSAGSLLRYFDAALLLWFIPYMCVRCSSEIWGGSIFFISLALVYRRNELNHQKFFIAGCLAALAFFLRPQTALLIAGFLCYRMFDLKRNYAGLLLYAAGGITIMLFNVFLDHLFYHQWCFTPWNYFVQNIIHRRAVDFGTEPFYYYFSTVFINAVPLQGILIIAAFLVYIAKRFRDEISFGVMFFLLGHFIISHKEMRFMFPLIFIIPFVLAYSMQWISQLRFAGSKIFKLLVLITIVINSAMLAAVTILPADSQVALQRKIYELSGTRSAMVFHESQNPYLRVGLNMNFYKNRKMILLPLDSLSNHINSSKANILIVTRNSSSFTNDRRFDCVYQDVPQWLLNLKFYYFNSKIKVDRIYKKN